MMKISWDTASFGTIHAKVDESDVLPMVENLSRLGFTATVEMLDNDSDN